MMTEKLRVILGDQLSHDLPILKHADPNNDAILMCEAWEEVRYTDHHVQKLVLVLSAMRHFAITLQKQGYQVYYFQLDEQPVARLDHAVWQAYHHLQPKQVVITEPGEWRIWQKIENWRNHLPVPLIVAEDQRFLCAIEDFKKWTQNRKRWVMEHFYRQMRRRYRLLLDDEGKPLGGRWNYDLYNRKTLESGHQPMTRPSFPADNVTQQVMGWVQKNCTNHFGNLHHFDWPVTRGEALQALEFFINDLLKEFGPYQDAMAYNQPYIYHSKLSALINIGLLNPKEVCEKAQRAYHEGIAPLASVEGFIRQVLGWREYMRGIYWTLMPQYSERNYFQASAGLPDFYWSADTKMACVSEAVQHTRDYAYSHHIQRLMITGNYALLAGIDPKVVCDWYLGVYADAYEWVELPNTLGMALFGDGGVLATKPYAASGKYINRMSNFCGACYYNPHQTTGERACPFNALFWHFLYRNHSLLRLLAWMLPVLATMQRMDADKLKDIVKQGDHVLNQHLP